MRRKRQEHQERQPGHQRHKQNAPAQQTHRIISQARPPQKLVGVGFTAQGNFVGSYYRINPEARSNPTVSWIFDGVTGINPRLKPFFH